MTLRKIPLTQGFLHQYPDRNRTTGLAVTSDRQASAERTHEGQELPITALGLRMLHGDENGGPTIEYINIL